MNQFFTKYKQEAETPQCHCVLPLHVLHVNEVGCTERMTMAVWSNSFHICFILFFNDLQAILTRKYWQFIRNIICDMWHKRWIVLLLNCLGYDMFWMVKNIVNNITDKYNLLAWPFKSSREVYCVASPHAQKPLWQAQGGVRTETVPLSVIIST